MGSIFSKICKMIPNPVKEYEKRKTRKIYRELFTSDPDGIVLAQYDPSDPNI